MLLDARQVDRDATLEADLCVVGAGAAGITLARALAATPLRVVLLESGGLEPHAPTQALYRGRVFGRNYFTLDSCRTRQLGGSTNCWRGMCRPLDALDFEERDWLPGSGWPFGAELLRPYYERAQQVLRLEGFDYAGARWASAGRPPLPFAGDEIETRVFQVAAHRFGELYRAELERAPNLRTLLFANAVGFETDPEGRAVQGVRVACLDGNRFRVRARANVLACGGIENARLLLASQLGNAHDLVGRHFMEHPHVVAGVLLPSSEALPLGLYRAHASGRVQVAGYLTSSEALRRRERLLAWCAFLAQEVELPEFEQGLARVVREIDGAAGGPAARAIFLTSELEQAPNPASRVRLIEERDALGLPRVQLEWRLSAVDKQSARRHQEILGAALGRAGLGRLQILLSEDERAWPEDLGGGRHHMGTTRMHADPRRGVVDADGRVHGLANLYVAGSSVFPTAGAANPTLTIVALALRLAEHLRGALA
jgi:choline dehydrogenase-like flavoprotein